MAARHHIRILVVDPNPASGTAVDQLLQEKGYRPFLYPVEEDALKIARDQSFQVALIDLGATPQIGFQTVTRLRELNSRMGCIVLASEPTLSGAVEAMRCGACDYLAKPVSADTLLEAIERACKALGLTYTNEAELNRFIGQRIRQERLRQNLTLRDLSDRTDLTTSQLSQVELGKNAASIWALARISNSLGMQMHMLIQGL